MVNCVISLMAQFSESLLFAKTFHFYLKTGKKRLLSGDMDLEINT